MNIRDWGYDGPAVLDKGALPARVLGTWGDYYRVVCDKGEGIARKKASAYFKRRVEDNAPSQEIPTTGDFVALHWNPHGESRILATLPRSSKFERAAAGTSGRRAQTIAVNFDTLFFLMSLNQNFSVRRLERFLALGHATGAGVVVLLTKSDLLGTDSGGAAPFLADAAACAGDVPVFAISSRTGDGLDQLAPYVLPRRTLAFIGSSGVGKSSLVNALAGEELMPTLEVRDWDSKGRHTTTERELIRLPSGALVIDRTRADPPAVGSARHRHARHARDRHVGGRHRHCRFFRGHRDARRRVQVLGLPPRHRTRLRCQGRPRLRSAFRRTLARLPQTQGGSGA